MSCTVTLTSIPDVLILEPEVYEDERGFFFESFNHRDFAQVTGLNVNFVQDNHSRSAKNVLRGMHYQIQHSQGKLVRVSQGAVFDVSVDLRSDSPYFGKWFGLELSSRNKRQLWIPPGFAHGFLVISKSAEVLYKTTDYRHPKQERCLLWNDPLIGVEWPIVKKPLLSLKDEHGKPLTEADVYV